MTDKELIKAALAARKSAYAPYSRYAVGAAVLTQSQKVFTGCNVENASYPAGLCAERVAIFKAVSEDERDILAIALVGGKDNCQGELPDYISPCGMCRQVMSEFGNENMRILLAKSENDYKEYTLGELLPLSFTAKSL